MKYSDDSNDTRDLIRAAFVKEQEEAPTIFHLGHLIAAGALFVAVLILGRMGLL